MSRKITGTRKLPFASKNQRKAVRSIVKKMIDVRQEDKYNIIGYNDPSLNNASLLQDISGLATGDGVARREGNQIRVKRLTLRGKFATNQTGYLPTAMRIIVFRDMNVKTAVANPTAADLLDFGAGGGNQVPTTYPYNPLNMKRFHILHDRVYNINVGGNEVVNFTWKKTYKNRLIVDYFGNTSSDGSRGSIWVLSLGDDAVDATKNPYLLYSMKMDFEDS